MPYGLFDFEDTIEPMGLSPVFEPQYKYGTDQFGLPTRQNVPPPQNTGIVTRAIPENPPAQSGIPSTAQKLVYNGAENSPFFNPVTDACIPSEGCNPNPVTAKIPENSTTPNPIMTFYKSPENPVTPAPAPVPNPVTLAMIGNEAPPINTLRMPENPVTPTPPSGQCPAGYQSSNQSSNQPLSNINNPYGLTAGQQIVGSSTGKPFNVNQAGSTWIPTGGGGGSGGGATNTYGQTNRPMINSEYWGRASSGGGGGGSGGGGGLPKWNASQMSQVRSPVSATAPNTWSGSQQQYTSMLSQLGLASAR